MEGLIGIFLLGLIIYLIIRHPLKSLSLAFKLVIIFILGIAGFLALFALLLNSIVPGTQTGDHLHTGDHRVPWTVCTPNELIGLHRLIPLW